MLEFPEDFLDEEGRFKAALTVDVPVAYFLTNGWIVCAACINEAPADVPPLDRTVDGQLVSSFIIVYDWPAFYCDRCNKSVEAPFSVDNYPL